MPRCWIFGDKEVSSLNEHCVQNVFPIVQNKIYITTSHKWVNSISYVGICEEEYRQYLIQLNMSTFSTISIIIGHHRTDTLIYQPIFDFCKT